MKTKFNQQDLKWQMYESELILWKFSGNFKRSICIVLKLVEYLNFMSCRKILTKTQLHYLQAYLQCKYLIKTAKHLLYSSAKLCNSLKIRTKVTFVIDVDEFINALQNARFYNLKYGNDRIVLLILRNEI